MTHDQHTKLYTQLKTDLGGLMGCSGCLELLALWLGIASCLGGWMFECPAVVRFGIIALAFVVLSKVATFVIVWVNIVRLRARMEAND